ncbi:glutaconate CoA-transferase [Desulfonema ishimotonii]|uniref:Glutaconate CoA-transferase n=1 Tax=Desulfonema ishimotonii TaxID=45657 RepID=A0A401FZS0_9BACT|nr:CoA-transferase [Desulfonema ishimotonii]GBC62458.1 glutaconate CoA-transferase [Desulfonema ishimotonii]
MLLAGNIEYTPQEMIVVAGARILEDKKVVFVGTGLPMIATVLAIRTHAPGIIPVFEAGAVGPTLESGLPFSVGDSRTSSGASYVRGLNAAFEMTQRGFCDYGFVGGAEIDPYGNLNSTMMGKFPEEYQKPAVRLPGSGGASDMASSCERTILIMPHEPRRFSETISYITSPGYLDGSPGARKRAGLTGAGPWRVITTKAVMDFDPETRRMRLLHTMPGETPESVQAATGFTLGIAPAVTGMAPPTETELRMIREEIDPLGVFVKKPVREKPVPNQF